jgi:hypothetical protein
LLLQKFRYANINWRELRRFVRRCAYRIFVHMCDKVMQQSNDIRPEEGTAVSGNQR